MSENTGMRADEPDSRAAADSTWFMTTPANMARVVSGTYQQILTAYGVRPVKVGLVRAYADAAAAPKLAVYDEEPADEALRTALALTADSYARAMAEFGMFEWVMTAIETQVAEEVSATIADHGRSLAMVSARPADPPAVDEADDGGETVQVGEATSTGG